MTMYDRLQVIAGRENIIAGVGNAEPFYELKERLKGITVPFTDHSIEERTEPSLTMPGVKSLVAVGLSYNVVYDSIDDGKYRGCMSSGAVGRDYHHVVREKLEIISNELLGEYSTMIFVDTGPLADREVAARCGLGTAGKNLSIINEKIGSMFFIGYMLTDMEYEKWEAPEVEKNTDICKDCRRCIEACPNNALENGICNYEKCISYLTQKKGILTYEESRAIGRQIYGCDVCQRVCPKNSGYIRARSPYAYPDIEELLSMSNKGFEKIYKPTAAGWRGRRTLQRNALIVLGNIKADAKDLLEGFAEDKREDISAAALYSLKRIKEK